MENTLIQKDLPTLRDPAGFPCDLFLDKHLNTGKPLQSSNPTPYSITLKHIAMYRIIMIMTVSVLITCCSSSNPQDNETPETSGSQINLAPIDYSFYDPVYIDTLMTDDLGKYIDYVAQTDYIAGISSSKNNPLEKELIYTFSETSDYITTKTGSTPPAFNIKINGTQVGSHAETKASAHWESIYGSHVYFEISAGSAMTRSASASETVDMYIPELIKVTSPIMQNESDMYPLCYYDGFTVRWNGDPENTNGVLVVIEWFGSMVFGDHNPNAYIRRTDRVDDTGEAVLSKDMFDDIPDTAICHLTLLRGNLENVIADDYSFKLFGESHQNFPFILIRNIRYKDR